MLSKNQLVLLKALFNKKLNDAVLKGDSKKVERIIKKEYPGEYNPQTVLNMEYIKKEHERQLKEDNFSWAL